MAKRVVKKPGRVELTSDNIRELQEVIQTGGGDAATLAQLRVPVRLSEMQPLVRRSTGIVSLDMALGGRGLADGRQYELSALESVGKTQRALRIAANMIMSTGRPALFLDVEGTIDPEWAAGQVYLEALGAGCDEETARNVANELFMDQPITAEVARMEMLMGIKNHYSMVIFDSVSVAEPEDSYIKREEGSVSSRKGVQASFMAETTRAVTCAHSRYASPTVVLWINQLRTSGDIISGRTFLDTTGGRALKFALAARISFKIIEVDKSTGDRKVLARVLKNKIGPPNGTCEIWISPDGSVDPTTDLVQSMLACGVVEELGSGKYSLLGKPMKCHGYEKMVAIVRGLSSETKSYLREKVAEAAANRKYVFNAEGE